MSKLVSRFAMFFRGKKPLRVKCLIIGLTAVAAIVGSAHGQDNRKVPISFVPPPLENATYSLGIYDAKSGRLVRRLQEIAPEGAFTVGLNGLMTSWDGKDDDGKVVTPGRYAARGYAVGALKVEGRQILDNDWVNDDKEMRIYPVQAIAIVPEDNGLAILANIPAGGELVARYGGTKNELLWQKATHGRDPALIAGVPVCSLTAQDSRLWAMVADKKAAYQLTDGSEVSPVPSQFASSDPPTSSTGKDGTTWKIESGVLCQYSSKGERLRSLTPKAGEPIPVAVAASRNIDRLFLLEQTENLSWQRVRGLAWKEATHEGEKAISTWETFFERSIHPLFDPGGPENRPPTSVELTLVDNPLAPGKSPHLKLEATWDLKGSYLATHEGLHLRQIGQWAPVAVKLTKVKTKSALSFYQSDGAAWDEFSIEGANNMMEFDAGEIEMTAEGEKTRAEKPAEPPDL